VGRLTGRCANALRSHPPTRRARAEGEEVTRIDREEKIARFIWPLPSKKRSLLWGLNRWSVVNGNILNSEGIRVGVVLGPNIFDLTGKKLYTLKGVNIYRPSGELVGHLSDARGSEKRLDRSTDKLFPST
jgi:hypothetical protein